MNKFKLPDLGEGLQEAEIIAAEEIEAALASGYATASAGPSFVCPVIPAPRR